MTAHLGDIVEDATVSFMWSTNDSSGASVTYTGGTVSVYKGADTTQTTAGVSNVPDFDGVTGVHSVTIATTDSFYDTGEDFHVVLSGATVDSQTVSAVLAHFSIENRSGLRPTTAGRTLDVASGGEAGVDLGNVTGTLGNANVGWVDTNDRVDLGTWLGSAPSSIVAGRVQTLVGLIDNNAITSASISAQAIEAAAFAADTLATFGVLTNTLIGTMASQTSFVITAGSSDDDAYIGCVAVIEDATTAAQKAVGVVSGYTGSSKTVVLLNDPGIFTMAEGDKIRILADRSLKPSTDNRTVGVEADGHGHADVKEIEGTAGKSAINIEVLDVHNTDTMTLPAQESPPLAPTEREAIGWLYKMMRNRKSETSTQFSLFADDESTVDAKATVSDDGTTAIKQEVVAGP